MPRRGTRQTGFSDAPALVADLLGAGVDVAVDEQIAVELDLGTGAQGALDRLGAPALLARGLWMPWRLNWWIGVVFALGATLFAVGCLLFLSPALAAQFSVSEDEANRVEKLSLELAGKRPEMQDLLQTFLP